MEVKSVLESLETAVTRQDINSLFIILHKNVRNIMNYNHRRLTRICFDMYGEEEIISDMTLHIIENIKKYKRSATGFRTWLSKVIHNWLVDKIKSRVIRQKYESNNIIIEKGYEEHMVEKIYRKQIKDITRECFDDKRVFNLYFIQEKKIGEIAQIMGITRKTVTARINRGIENTRRKLGVVVDKKTA